ncbi:hypothetical protein COOONC_15418 [Cooperia oncophora]
MLRWYQRFTTGEYSLEDEDRSGRPSELDMRQLRRVLKSDPFQSTRDMASTLDTHHSLVEAGLQKLGITTKLGRFVPHRLKPADLDRRVDACLTLLTMHKGYKWLDHLGREVDLSRHLPQESAVGSTWRRAQGDPEGDAPEEGFCPYGGVYGVPFNGNYWVRGRHHG